MMNGRRGGYEGALGQTGSWERMDTVRLAVADTLDMDVSGLTEDMDLLRTGRMDSLAIVTLLSHIESEFDLTVPLEMVVPENFGSVRRIQAMIIAARDTSGT